MRGKHAAKTAHRQATTLADELAEARAKIKTLQDQAKLAERRHADELATLRRDDAATLAARIEAGRMADDDRRVADRVELEVERLRREWRRACAEAVGQWLDAYAIKVPKGAPGALAKLLGTRVYDASDRPRDAFIADAIRAAR